MQAFAIILLIILFGFIIAELVSLIMKIKNEAKKRKQRKQAEAEVNAQQICSVPSTDGVENKDKEA